MTALLRTREDLAAARSAWIREGRPVALVPTMGALHRGHRALLDAARAADPGAALVATVFVNPLQFGEAADLAAYPRTLDADVSTCAEAGVDVVWAPATDEVYASGTPRVTVSAGLLGDVLEGAARPGHFDGVLTVVLKLWHLSGARVAWFGEKDAQQLVLVRRMALDLDAGVRVRSVPTVRDPDGLALSSRNARLSAAERDRALALPGALEAAVAVAEQGREAVCAAARAVLADAGVAPDYVAVVDDHLDTDVRAGPGRLLVAARVGAARLIDTTTLHLGPRGAGAAEREGTR